MGIVGTIVTNADVEMKEDAIIDTNLLYAPNSVVDISGKSIRTGSGETVKYLETQKLLIHLLVNLFPYLVMAIQENLIY